MLSSSSDIIDFSIIIDQKLYMKKQNITDNYLIVLPIVSLIGSSIVFLWFNCKKASIFMGDVGSIFIGGYLGFLFVLIKQEILLIIVGGVFVVEALSVILQVLYFKYSRGKRLFLMAPIHHHFEKKGISEEKIVVRFWLVNIILAMISVFIILSC
ncbi:MAG TPA: hypothetical protein QKA14_00425 [Candidatus Megaira endosymbiont of Hartmannula sinica]|nr:hypothetical protein [Candidatus Megaera endosymbiont of Hartmannula sinica]